MNILFIDAEGSVEIVDIDEYIFVYIDAGGRVEIVDIDKYICIYRC